MRPTLLITGIAVARVFVAQAVGTPFGAYGAFSSACTKPSSHAIWGVFCLISWIWVNIFHSVCSEDSFYLFM